MLPETFVTLDSESVKIWELNTVKDLQSTLGVMLDEYGYDSAGISRALSPASQSFILVLATLLPPCVISHVVAPRGVDRLYIKLHYVLTDEAGEMHKPKDEKRIEIAIEADVEAAMRAAVLSDAREMSRNRDTRPRSAAGTRTFDTHSDSLSCGRLIASAPWRALFLVCGCRPDVFS